MSEDRSSELDLGSFFNDLHKAQEGGSPSGFLVKGDFSNISRLAGDNGLNAASSYGGRAKSHINRLLEDGRSDTERNFGEALIHYAIEYPLDANIDFTARDITHTLSGEGSDTCMWWTLSPYIYAELQPKVGNTQAVKLLLDWSRQGRTRSDFPQKKINLSGLDRYNNVIRVNKTFTLSRDPNHASHQFAKQEAQRVVRQTPVFNPQ